MDLVRDLCERFALIHCVDPITSKPATGWTNDFRLHGRAGYNYRCQDAELEDLLKFIAENVTGECFVLFNNVYMWEDAARFVSLLR